MQDINFLISIFKSKTPVCRGFRLGQLPMIARTKLTQESIFSACLPDTWLSNRQHSGQETATRHDMTIKMYSRTNALK